MSKVRIGVVEVCPDQTPFCLGQFQRKSAAQKRCSQCTRWWKNHRSKLYQRGKRANPEQYKEIIEEEKTKRKLDKSKQSEIHPCWCCGQPTKRQALCDVCYTDDGKVRHGSEGTCYLNRQKLDKIGRQWRKQLYDKTVKVYSSKEMTQEELQLLVPSYEEA